MKVLVTSNSFGKYSQEPKKILERYGLEVVLNPYHRMMTEEELIGQIKDADAVILSTEIMNKTVIDAAPKLKVISRYGVGTDNIDKDYCREKGIKVTIAKNANSNAVAEFAVTLMLAALKGVCTSNGYAKQGLWKKVEGMDLSGKTIGIIGLGTIGKKVAQKLSSFDVNLIAHDIYYDEAFVKNYNIKKMNFEDVIKQSDIITLHVPSLNTKPLLSYKEFGEMKQDVIIINTARATLLDNDALIEYLDKKKIFAVGLDVHPDEPHFDKRLFKYENVILTPHNAAVSRGAIDQVSMMAVKNIIESLKLEK